MTEMGFCMTAKNKKIFPPDWFFVTINTISKRKLMNYWLLLMKDKERKLTCISESPIVSYKRNDNLSKILTSLYTNNL